MEATNLGVSIQLGRLNIAAERRQTSLDRLSPQTSSWYPEAKNSKATNTSHPLYVPCHLLRSCSNRMDFCMEEGHLPPFCQALAQQVLNLGNRRHEAVTKKLSRAKNTAPRTCDDWSLHLHFTSRRLFLGESDNPHHHPGKGSACSQPRLQSKNDKIVGPNGSFPK